MDLHSETGIGHLIFEQAAEIRELKEKAERYDRALASVEWMLAAEASRGNRLLSTGLLLDALGAVGHYGSCGLKTHLMEDLLVDLEKRVG